MIIDTPDAIAAETPAAEPVRAPAPRPPATERQAAARPVRRHSADQPGPRAAPTPAAEDPARADLVDRIAAWAVEEGAAAPGESLEALKTRIRAELGGRRHYVPSGVGSAGAVPEDTRRAVLSMFTGRNVSEVARRLGIGRATVYRVIRQPGLKR